MGIIYQFAIRFIKVKDLSKVDLGVAKTEDEKNDTAFADYLIKAKENLLVKLKEVIYDPGCKRSYEVLGIKVPDGTEVITFGNDACDRMGGAVYEIKFHHENPDHDYDKSCFVDVERNRFMLIPEKVPDSRLVSIDYCIGHDARNTFEEKLCQVSLLNEEGVWTRLPGPGEEGYVTSSDEDADEPLPEGVYRTPRTIHNK